MHGPAFLEQHAPHSPYPGSRAAPTLDGDKLICTQGSETKGTFAAFDKSTGQVLWRSTDVTARAEYGSPILIEHNNVRQVVTMSRSGLVAAPVRAP